MSRTPLPELLQFLKPFDKKVQETALLLRDAVLSSFPDANELIYDNYNALAIGYSLSDKQKEMFCHIAVYSKYVNIGFDRGVQLDDPEKLLKGTGNRIRHITVNDFKDFPKVYVKKLLKQAYSICLAALPGKQTIKALSIVKSVSPNKKRPV
jgi:hypothetical protein